MPILDLFASFHEYLHPLGEARWLRWLVFAAIVGVFVAYPLFFRKRIARTKDGVSTYEASSSKLWIPIGALLLILALALVVLPYLPLGYGEDDASVVRELQWKIFNPFDSSTNANRIILFLGVAPLVVGIPLLQYFFIRRNLAKPARLMMAGLRMIVLWLAFLLFCGPYTSITPEEKEPWRSAVLIDASKSMNHRAEPLSPFVSLAYNEEILSSSAVVKVGDRELPLAEVVEADHVESQALMDYLSRSLRIPGLAEELRPYAISAFDPELFNLRRMTRKVVRHRATRLMRKLELLRGARPDLAKLEELRAEIKTKNDELEIVLSDLAIERSGMRGASVILLERKADSLRSEIADRERQRAAILKGGELFDVIATQRAALEAGSSEFERLGGLEIRLATAIKNLVDNLTSTVNREGPTRWDIATELLMPGMGASRNSEDRGMPLEIGAEQLALIDALRRNSSAQADRLPADIAKLVADAALKPSENYRQILASLRSAKALPEDLAELTPSAAEGELVSVYTFSAPDFGSLSTRSYQQTSLEELDFMRANGVMTKLMDAYSAVIRKESSGDVANIFVLSDGVDTSSDAAKHFKSAQALRWTLENNADGPRIFSVLVGHSSQGKLLELSKVKAPDTVFLGEMVSFELTVKANQDWKDVEVILENDRGLEESEEITYDILNDEAGLRFVDVRRTRGDAGTFLNFVRLAFTPEVDENDKNAKRDKKGRYWDFNLIFRLNRQAMPGEQTYENNYLKKKIRVRDQKIRVLLIDQRFRYETRYLVEAMARDKTLEMHSFIIDADQQWPQRTSEYSPEARRRMPPLVNPFCKILFEGTSKAKTTTATTFEDWNSNSYDVVILGDVHSQTLSADERAWLTEYVRKQKGGLILLAGQYNMPWSYTLGDIAELIPVKVPEEARDARVDTTKTHFYGITPIGQSSEILSFSIDANRQRELWGSATAKGHYRRGQLDGYYWYAKTDGPKDSSCMVLARVAEDDGKLNFDYGEGAPSDELIVAREEEEGRVLYFGTDEFWRMRRYFGDFYTYRLWQNSIRWAAARHLDRADDDLEILTDQQTYQLGNTVHAFCDFLGGDSLVEQVRRAQDSARQSAGIEDTNAPVLLEWKVISSDVADSENAKRSDIIALLADHGTRRYEGTFTPNLPGRYQLSVVNDIYPERQPYFFTVEASTEAKREKDETPLVSADNLLPLASRRLEGEATANPSGAEESGEEVARWFATFGSIDELITVERDSVISRGNTETPAWNLLELLIVLASLLAVEWFARKLVRLA